MSDRELLELAAKAAGYTSYGYAELIGGCPALCLREADFTGMWAPLTDDGDALRLSVKCGIGMVHHLGWGQVFHPSLDGERMDFHYDPNAQTATRRAIVCAAAALAQTRDA